MESNVQKMIEGISEIRKGLHGMLSGKFPLERHFISALLGRCDGLLELPPRNCNVGTVEEQWKRFRLFCESHKPAEPEFTGIGELLCPVSGCELEVCNYGQCALKWAQMPYEADAERKGDGK